MFFSVSDNERFLSENYSRCYWLKCLFWDTYGVFLMVLVSFVGEINCLAETLNADRLKGFQYWPVLVSSSKKKKKKAVRQGSKAAWKKVKRLMACSETLDAAVTTYWRKEARKKRINSKLSSWRRNIFLRGGLCSGPCVCVCICTFKSFFSKPAGVLVDSSLLTSSKLTERTHSQPSCVLYL